MPKKTKKEKLLAQHHRTNLPLAVPESRSPEPMTTETLSFHLTVPPIQSPVSSYAIATSVDEFSAIQRDLVKTLLITVGIIASEFLLAHYLPH